MRILLVGEYSGVHSKLTDKLREKNLDVICCIHDGDGYKNLKADFLIKYKRHSSNNRIIKKSLNLYYIILGSLGIRGIVQIWKYRKLILKLKGYDIVQLINPIFLSDFGVWVNFLIFLFLKKNNKKIFLCALGDDYYWIRESLDKKYKYSMFDRLNRKTYKHFLGQLQWVYNPIYIFINKYIVSNSNAVIPGLYDYYLAYKHLENCSSIVPLMIYPTDKEVLTNVEYPINIFHGWQTGKEMRKGNDIFHDVLLTIKKNYKDKVDYVIVSGLTYDEYIKRFGDCHIFIDQCYSYDCGVNGLLGMAEGKVVFSGMESEVLQYYNLEYKPLINAIPEKDSLYKILEKLILNPKSIESFSKDGKRFINKYHSPDYVLEKYEEVWLKY